MAGMDERRSNWLAPVVIAVVLTVLAVAYPCAYFWTGMRGNSAPGPPVITRMYRTRWHVMVFRPAAKAESLLCREPALASER
jgi:hypothetical protein